MSSKQEEFDIDFEDEDEDNSDAEYSPLVDGLSSAVVVVALISFVFLITTINTSVNLYSSFVTFQKAELKDNNQVNFELGLSLTPDTVNILRKAIESESGNIVEFNFVINSELDNVNRLAQLAFINLNEKLSLTKKMRIGTITNGSCDNTEKSCFTWLVK